jgi:hypothetical protein
MSDTKPAPALRWSPDRHGWIAPCGSEGQGECRVLRVRTGFRWVLDMLPGDSEPTVTSPTIFADLEAAKAAAEAQADAWPSLVGDARRV